MPNQRPRVHCPSPFVPCTNECNPTSPDRWQTNLSRYGVRGTIVGCRHGGECTHALCYHAHRGWHARMPCATMLTAAGTHACPVLPCSPRLARAHVRLPKIWRNRIIGHGGRNSLHDRAGNVRNLLRTRRGRIHLVVPDHIVANDGIPLVHASWCLPSAGNRGSRHHHTRAAYSIKLMPKDVEAHSCYFFQNQILVCCSDHGPRTHVCPECVVHTSDRDASAQKRCT
jgi:hypothetical protein